jgi:hypothetical protein
MAVVYHHLPRGEPGDAALRVAKLRCLASGTGLADRHDRAAFVLAGDGFRPIPRAFSWGQAAPAAAVALAAAIAIVWWHGARRAAPRHAPAA